MRGLLTGTRRKKVAVRRRRKAAQGVIVVLPVGFHYAEGGAALERLEAKLGGSASSLYRGNGRQIQRVRPGIHCLVVDSIDQTLEVVVATDVVRDGKGRIVAYEPFSRIADRRLTKALRRKLAEMGLAPSKKGFRTQWLDASTATAVVGELCGANVRRRFAADIKRD